MSKTVYAADKPDDCRFCYFWKNRKQGCRLGKENCYYLISVPPKPKTECDGCPYGRDHPCIGWCTKKIMRDVGGSLICVIMNTIAVISRSAAKTVRIISHDGDTVPVLLSAARTD